jgi:hypothetical protein
VNNGTITLTGTAGSPVYCYASLFDTGRLKVFNLVINTSGIDVYLNPDAGQTGIEVINNLTISAANVFTTNGSFSSNYFSVGENLTVNSAAQFQHGAFNSVVEGQLNVSGNGVITIDNGGSCTVNGN